jgi:hypothetical protein
LVFAYFPGNAGSFYPVLDCFRAVLYVTGKRDEFPVQIRAIFVGVLGRYCPLYVCGRPGIIARCFFDMKYSVSHFILIAKNFNQTLPDFRGIPKGLPLWLIGAFLAERNVALRKCPKKLWHFPK